MKKQYAIIRISGYLGLAFILSCLYFFLKFTDTSLSYYWQQSIALPLSSALKYPGGFSDMTGDWLLEFLNSPVPAFLATAFTGLLFFLGMHLVFRPMNRNPLYYTLVLTALVSFLLLFGHYRLPVGLIVSLLTGLILSALHLFFNPGRVLVACVYKFLTAMLIYLLAGPAGLIVFIQVILSRILSERRFSELFRLLPVLLIPVLYLPLNPFLTLKMAYFRSYMISEYNLIPVLFYLANFSVSILFILLILFNSVFSSLRPVGAVITGLTGVLALSVLFIPLYRTQVNEVEKNIFTIEKAGFDRDWNRVIELTNRQSYLNQLVQFEVNRALYHKGELLDKLFWYPQPFGEKGIFLEQDINSRLAIHISDFYMDLGYATETMHWATESQMVLKRHPVLLKELILSNLALGNRRFAMKYFDILSHSRLYRDWCRTVEEKLEGGDIQDDPVIHAFLSNNPENDFFAITANPTWKLSTFFLNNPENNMAFEFVVASCLLQHQVGNVVSYLPRFREFGYEKLPRLVEEAVLVSIARSKDEPFDFAGYILSEKTIKDFGEFNRLMATARNREDAMNKVAAFRNTFWYYILFTSPYATKK